MSRFNWTSQRFKRTLSTILEATQKWPKEHQQSCQILRSSVWRTLPKETRFSKSSLKKPSLQACTPNRLLKLHKQMVHRNRIRRRRPSRRSSRRMSDLDGLLPDWQGFRQIAKSLNAKQMRNMKLYSKLLERRGRESVVTWHWTTFRYLGGDGMSMVMACLV